jgi:hypothetical protein
MRRFWVWFVISAIASVGLLPTACAKTHKDNFSVSCDVLWPAVKDAVRNSGKYGIVGIDNTEMSISYVIGGTLGGKRINSVVLNRLSATSCEMQTQTAYSGLIHNDAGDFKQRVDESLKKLQASGATPADPVAADIKSGDATTAQNAAPPAELKNGLTIEEVEKLVGRPKDTVKLKDSVVYIYPAYKVVFENGKVTEIQTPDAVGK